MLCGDMWLVRVCNLRRTSGGFGICRFKKNLIKLLFDEEKTTKLIIDERYRLCYVQTLAT